MSVLEREIKIDISAEQAWSVLADFENIHAFAPGIKASPLLSETKNGVGACRRCAFSMGGMSMVETITAWEEGRSFTIELSEFPMPFHRGVMTFMVTSLLDNQCLVKAVLNYDMKYGFFGAIMNKLMIRPMMGMQFNKLLKGIEEYAKKSLATTPLSVG